MLTLRERVIIDLTFGFAGQKATSAQDIADRLGISRRRVGQILDRAIQKLGIESVEVRTDPAGSPQFLVTYIHTAEQLTEWVDRETPKDYSTDPQIQAILNTRTA